MTGKALTSPLRSLLLALLLARSGAASAEQGEYSRPSAPPPAAMAAAEAWLSSADRGAYDEAWDATWHFFRNVTPRATFVRSLQNIRGPVGALRERALTISTPARHLPALPGGEFWVLEFRSTFERDTLREILFLRHMADETWVVASFLVL